MGGVLGSTDSVFGAAGEARLAATVDSYKRLADVFHDVLSELSLDTLLEKIADTLSEIVPYDTLTIYRADERQRTLTPVLARDQWAEEIMKRRSLAFR